MSATVTILDLSGKLTLNDGSGVLKDRVSNLISQGQKSIVLNLGNLTYMDSAGLGEMVACHSTAMKNGGKWRSCEYDRQDEGPTDDHEARDRFRQLRRRRRGGEEFGVVARNHEPGAGKCLICVSSSHFRFLVPDSRFLVPAPGPGRSGARDPLSFSVRRRLGAGREARRCTPPQPARMPLSWRDPR